MSAMVTQIA
jgi:hypothetical protein